ncbi:MAG TPA: hypothetical protein VGD45_12080 [Steroidobacter sp.]|uniref:hypothetical protein n=1 Tax=Steroidobacter sp. TaxID=1978227 RepID=UPI002ED94693
MKTAAVFFSGVMLSALACAPAAAETVRVRLTARVTSVNDPGTLLHGAIVLGQRLTGTYVYNTNTPDWETGTSDFGFYVPYANEARVRLVSGGVVFESAQPTQGISIAIDSHADNGNGMFNFRSVDNKPLPSTMDVDEISVQFEGAGTVTESDALPSVAPDLLNYPTKMVTVRGPGNNFEVVADIETAELIVTGALELSPAAGSFVPTQHFDAAVTLPRNTTPASAQATANGVTLPLSYPGTCQLLPPDQANQRALLCPNADAVLPQAAGAPIEWTVVLTNGTTLTQSVNWTLAM